MATVNSGHLPGNRLMMSPTPHGLAQDCMWAMKIGLPSQAGPDVVFLTNTMEGI